MKGSKTANRYAQALLDLAIERNVLDVVAGDMKFLSIVCAENRDFELMLASPIVRADKKIAVLKTVFTHFDALSTQFIELIAKNGREAILPEIAIAFEAQLNDHRGILPCLLYTSDAADE
jgi:F-type H+-transporting ATPase subunit delta